MIPSRPPSTKSGQLQSSAPAAEEYLNKALALTAHVADARVVAAAWGAGADFLVTLDQEHMLDVPKLRAAAPFPLGTPGDFLSWLRGRLS